ncbi:unnamed protein product [Lactuca saligna]|uniref:Uncharacterized protein n=1 Tax=Lactuca saligna TaxID=75948 RepID=A0AA35Z6H2_LACSI|nr:unnamed protein product [Lactuca saligna]
MTGEVANRNKLTSDDGWSSTRTAAVRHRRNTATIVRRACGWWQKKKRKKGGAGWQRSSVLALSITTQGSSSDYRVDSTRPFDLKEDNFLDHILMPRKQFKIMNQNLNSLLKLQVDSGSQNVVSRIEVDVLLQAQENRLRMVIEKIESQHEECLKRHLGNFQYEVKDLRSVAKERYILFVEEVVEFYNSIITKVDSKIESDSKVFAKLEGFLGSLKESLSKLDVSPSSLIS